MMEKRTEHVFVADIQKTVCLNSNQEQFPKRVISFNVHQDILYGNFHTFLFR